MSSQQSSAVLSDLLSEARKNANLLLLLLNTNHAHSHAHVNETPVRPGYGITFLIQKKGELVFGLMIVAILYGSVSSALKLIWNLEESKTLPDT